LESGFRALFLPALNSTAGTAYGQPSIRQPFTAEQTVKQASSVILSIGEQ
jgi:hypothetical protein